MPVLILFLIAIGIIGMVQGPNSNQSGESSSGFSVSAQFSNPDTNTGLIPGGVVSDLNPSSQNVTPSTPATPADTVNFSINTLSAINIDFNRVTLRGSVVIPSSYKPGPLFFIYSESQSDLISSTKSTDTYEKISDNQKVKTSLISRSIKNSNTYIQNISSLADGEKYYYRMCFEQVGALLSCGPVLSFETVENIYQSSYYSIPSVSTLRAENIQGYSATIKGNYRLNSAENATAFFVYGESQSLVNEIPTEYKEYGDVKEAEENLQKIRLGAQAKNTDSPERTIDDLERDTTYYYRLCVAYDDENATEIKCGSVLNFTTDRKDRDVPSVRSTQAIAGGSTVSFSANIDMQDYRNGHAFLVYGTSESNIDRVSELTRFTQIYQNNDLIQRVSLDTDFDGRDTITRNISNLLAATDYYYRFCVEYEALDDYSRETFFLSCSDTKTFSTN